MANIRDSRNEQMVAQLTALFARVGGFITLNNRIRPHYFQLGVFLRHQNWAPSDGLAVCLPCLRAQMFWQHCIGLKGP